MVDVVEFQHSTSIYVPRSHNDSLKHSPQPLSANRSLQFRTRHLVANMKLLTVAATLAMASSAIALGPPAGAPNVLPQGGEPSSNTATRDESACWYLHRRSGGWVNLCNKTWKTQTVIPTYGTVAPSYQTVVPNYDPTRSDRPYQTHPHQWHGRPHKAK